MQDCVIGCFAGYGWDDVKVWALSLAASGFAGRKVALVRAPAAGCVERLLPLGFEVVDFTNLPAGATPYIERFTQIRRYLHNRRRQGVTYRWVVATDVRDLCFQRDPLGYLTRLDPPRLVLSPEGLGYEHAEWNAVNLMRAYGTETLEMLRHAAPSNVGVLAGGHWTIEGLSLLIEQLSRAAQNEFNDQAALNLLVEALAGSLWLHRAGSDEPWACNGGVMGDPRRIAGNRPHLLGPEPVWRNGAVQTAGGEPYAIVHQYDRVPQWQAAIAARFAG